MKESRIQVSVIIPTYGRANLLGRAIRSAQSQSLNDLEIVVVVDGHDPETVSLLESIDDTRVRSITLPGASGGARARNAGVQSAQGEWVAFLDDDDEWLPEKLELQLSAAHASTSTFPVVSTKIIVRGEQGDLVWPRRSPAPGEPISEYLFCRSGLFSGDGQLQTSAIFTRRQLMLLCPFNPNVRKHDDTEWYLTVSARQDTSFTILPEPLTIWYQTSSLPRVSLMGDWRSSFEWARSCRTLMTPKAYASFQLSAVASEAAETHSLNGLFHSFQDAFRFGKPRLLDLSLAVSFVLFPRSFRQKLRLLRERSRGQAKPALAPKLDDTQGLH